jgi:hypothetical protein
MEMNNKQAWISDGLRREMLLADQAKDDRLLSNGIRIPALAYADQPYLLQADDGALVCILTTGEGREGMSGQQVASLRSEDEGATWSTPLPLEPPDGVESSYAVLLKTPGGRIYAFYNHNTDNIRRVPGDSPPYTDGYCYRVDSLGYFVFKYSDDHGKSWSKERYTIPVREFEIDRENTTGGKIRYFWNVGRAFSHQGKGYIPLIKVGSFGAGFFTRSEGSLLCSDNILTEKDPNRIRFVTLPDGDIGLKAPEGAGSISEEHSFTVLSDGSFFCVYRTVSGSPACSYSRDEGHTWSTPDFLRYPDGRKVKNPRAANFIWRLSGNRYLYWFHNHGGKGYEDRNPVWCLAGREVDGAEGKQLAFSEPEILLYDDETFIRMSYPDLIERNGEVYFTETQKTIARMHRIPSSMLNRLWSNDKTQPKDATCLLSAEQGGTVAMPPLPKLCQRDVRRADHGQVDLRQGFTISLALTLPPTAKGPRILLDNRSDEATGWRLKLTKAGGLQLWMSDGQTECLHTSESGLIGVGQTHAVGVVVDGGPKIVSFIVDGKFCDGGDEKQFGWSRFSPNLRSVEGRSDLFIDQSVNALRIFDRSLMTIEVINLC